MREIKFRAWVRESKNRFRMEYGCPFELSVHESTDYMDNLKKFSYLGASLCSPSNGSIISVMQYTGLLDKNGKEIYEGDITNNGVIEWCECLNWDSGGSNHPGFYFKNRWELGKRGEMEYHYGFDKDLEVIGNIYENPELVNDRDQKSG
jgi:hypothetical protein